MARRVETYVRLIDDLDGTVLPLGEGETIKYGMEGIEYEIDLKPEHAEQFRTMMAPIVAASSRTGGRKIAQRKTAKAVPPSAPKEITAGEKTTMTYKEVMARRKTLREVREWANANGYEQGMSGNIRDDVRAAWNEAHPDRPVPDPVSSSVQHGA